MYEIQVLLKNREKQRVIIVQKCLLIRARISGGKNGNIERMR